VSRPCIQTGIMLVDYFIVRRQQLDLVALYVRGGQYADVSTAGLVAFIIPVTLTVFSLFSGYFSWFYTYGWFTGSFTGAVIYYLLKRN
jgi:nucleobase:cation symporter-1, NCS1 family